MSSDLDTTSAPAEQPGAGTGAATPAPSWPPLWLAFVHLAALWAITFVQPLFDVLGKNAAFFVARDNTAGDLLIFALTFVILPPLVFTALVALARLFSAKAGRVLLSIFVGLIVGMLALQILKGILPNQSAVLFPVCAAIAGVVAWIYATRPGFRSLATVLGPAPIVILGLFLLFTPVNDLIFPQSSVASAGTGNSRTPVVMIVFDELPAMSLMNAGMGIDGARLPHFAELARSSTWYRNTTTVADGTYVAVPAILSGKRPTDQLPTAQNYTQSLFTLLGRRYNQHVEEPITHVCPSTLCEARAQQSQGDRLSSLFDDLRVVEERLVLPGDIADTLPPIDQNWQDFTAQAGNDGLAASAAKQQQPASSSQTFHGHPLAGDDLFVQRVQDGRAVVRTIGDQGTRPGLWMVHYVMPHVPWRFMPDGTQYLVDGPNMPGLDDQTWGKNQFLVNQGYQRHLLQLGFADELLGEVIAQMKRTGMWDKSLVIVVADHGQSSRPGGSRRPVTKQNFPDVANVPLFVKLPGQSTGHVDDGARETIDIVPTVAKVVGAGKGWKFDGTPVDEPKPANFEPGVRNGRLAKIVSVPFTTFLADRAKQLKVQFAHFPPDDPADIFRVGPDAQLVGRRVANLPQDHGGSVQSIDNAAVYRDVQPMRTGVTPTYVTGRLSGVKPGQALAIAIDGKIVSTARSYANHSDVRFSSIVPPESLRPGRNKVDVYAIEGGRLRLVAQAP